MPFNPIVSPFFAHSGLMEKSRTHAHTRRAAISQTRTTSCTSESATRAEVNHGSRVGYWRFLQHAALGKSGAQKECRSGYQVRVLLTCWKDGTCWTPGYGTVRYHYLDRGRADTVIAFESSRTTDKNHCVADSLMWATGISSSLWGPLVVKSDRMTIPLMRLS